MKWITTGNPVRAGWYIILTKHESCFDDENGLSHEVDYYNGNKWNDDCWVIYSYYGPFDTQFMAEKFASKL